MVANPITDKRIAPNAADVVRLYYYNDEMPYFIDHGPPREVNDRLEIEGVPFRVYRVRNIPDNEEQRLWIE